MVFPWWGCTTTLAPRLLVGLPLLRSRSRWSPPPLLMSFLFPRHSSARGATAPTPGPAPAAAPPAPLPALLVHLKRLEIAPSFGVPPLIFRCWRKLAAVLAGLPPLPSL